MEFGDCREMRSSDIRAVAHAGNGRHDGVAHRRVRSHTETYVPLQIGVVELTVSVEPSDIVSVAVTLNPPRGLPATLPLHVLAVDAFVDVRLVCRLAGFDYRRVGFVERERNIGDAPGREIGVAVGEVVGERATVMQVGIGTVKGPQFPVP